MNETEVNDALKRAAHYILEEWAMAFVDEAEPGLQEEEVPPIVAKLNFEGDIGICGEIAVLTRDTFAETVTRNVLGVDSDEEIEPQTKSDALKELVNVLGGHFLTEAFGKVPIFKLTAPECELIELDSLPLVCEQFHNWFLADDQPVGVKVVFKKS